MIRPRLSHKVLQTEVDRMELLQTALEDSRRETTFARANIKIMNLAGGSAVRRVLCAVCRSLYRVPCAVCSAPCAVWYVPWSVWCVPCATCCGGSTLLAERALRLMHPHLA